MTDLRAWRALDYEPPRTLEGRVTRLARLDPAEHAAALHASNPLTDDHWAFMPYGPFPDLAVYRLWAEGAAASDDPAYYAVHGAQGWSGVAALMRIDRANGVLEIGHLAFSPGLQRTAAATEAIHLLLEQAFAAGFRRVEWKCNARNDASRRAAERLGFAYEGTFRQHMVVKGRNRDSAWYAILDGNWPRLRAAHRRWLDPGNFAADGAQIRPLRV